MQNIIDTNFILQRQEYIKQQLHLFIDKNKIKEIFVYVKDIYNPFLDISTASFDYIQQYKQTKIITPAIINKNDINKADLNQIDYLIMFEQKESNKNDITYYIDEYKGKLTFFITFLTVSKYGIYDNFSMDMYFLSLI